MLRYINPVVQDWSGLRLNMRLLVLSQPQAVGQVLQRVVRMLMLFSRR